MPDELEERLKSHARSFDSLLSLIPAKLYYGEDVSDQWKRKKQTPEQKRAAKQAKLDPDNWKSAKDVMDERAAAALKRKREEEGDVSDEQLVEPEKPKLLQDSENPKAKKRKTEPEQNNDLMKEQKDSTSDNSEDKIRRKAEQRAEKKRRKAEKKAKVQEKFDRQKARKQETTTTTTSDAKVVTKKPKHSNNIETDKDEDEDDLAEEIELDGKPSTVLTTTIPDDVSTSPSSVEDEPEVFSPPLESGASSISSIQPVLPESSVKAQSKLAKEASSITATTVDSNADQTDPRERLQAAISAFRAERKADAPTGPKNRQELLQQRRQQEERRRAEKKEQKRREKEEQARIQDEEIAKRFSPGGSGSLLASPRSPLIDTPEQVNNFSFGRIAFDDGTNLDPNNPSLTQSQNNQKRKGPSDPATALQAAQNKSQRLSGLDPEKRTLIEQKDMWMNARKRASGEKVKDDTSLLKKALKRHDGQKRKSEKDWTDRKEGVQKSIEMKQKKRTENLAKRKDEKKSGKGSSKGKGSKVKRPGFEGSFKGRTGGGKKK